VHLLLVLIALVLAKERLGDSSGLQLTSCAAWISAPLWCIPRMGSVVVSFQIRVPDEGLRRAILVVAADVAVVEDVADWGHGWGGSARSVQVS